MDLLIFQIPYDLKKKFHFFKKMFADFVTSFCNKILHHKQDFSSWLN